MKILLVEPEFPIPKKSKNHKNFLPIGLLKISSYLKKEKKVSKIELVRGKKIDIDFTPNEIWITSLFTYWSKYFWESVEFYRNRFPKSKIKIGGIYVSLHFNQPEFIKLCKKYNVQKHFGILKSAEKQIPDYSLISTNPHPLDYQIIHSTRGCPRQCSFCYTWKIEPNFTSKKSIKKEIRTNKLIFYDNNLFMNEHIEKLLEEISEVRFNNKAIICESQSGFDGRILEEKPELAIALKKARFQNIRIAWDGKFNGWKRIKKQVDILRIAKYHSKEISVFMIFNWKIPYKSMEKKRMKCWDWRVQITDCRYRPIERTKDDQFNLKKSQKNDEYHIEKPWTDASVKSFRSNIRKHNICVRHNFPFYSRDLENKKVTKKESMRLRNLSKEEIRKELKDAWFPDEYHPSYRTWPVKKKQISS